MKKPIIILFILFGTHFSVLASALKDNAKTLYQEGKYTEAITLWDSIIQQEGTTPEALYNKGNAFYKLGQNAQAVLYYEKALLLSPEDEDIQHNIKVVNAQLKDQVKAIPDLFFMVWINKLNLWLSGTTWGIISIVFFIGFLGILLWKMFSPNPNKYTIAYLLILTLIVSAISLALALRANSLMKSTNKAIVMQDILVKSAPENTGTNLFEIHEGLKVEIQDSVNGFFEIRLEDGKKGWITTESIEKI